MLVGREHTGLGTDYELAPISVDRTGPDLVWL